MQREIEVADAVERQSIVGALAYLVKIRRVPIWQPYAGTYVIFSGKKAVKQCCMSRIDLKFNVTVIT